MRARFVGVVALGLVPSTARAQAAGFGPIVLQLPASTRAIGFGNAYVGVREPEAVFYNPAQLGTSQKVGVDMLQVPTLAGPSIEIVDGHDLDRGLSVLAANVEIHGIAIHGFGNSVNGSDADLYVQPSGFYAMDHSRQIVLQGPKGEPLALLADDKGPQAMAAELARWVR